MADRTSVYALLGSLLLCCGCITIRPSSAKTDSRAVIISNVPVKTWGDNSCGAGALSTVLNHFGDPVTEGELDRSLPKGRHAGVVSVDLLLEARSRGFDAQLHPGSLDEVLASLHRGVPVILMLRVLDVPGSAGDLFHYVVADGYDDPRQLIRFQFGDGRLRWAPISALEKGWVGAGRAMLIIDRSTSPDETLRVALRAVVALEDAGKNDEALARYRELSTRFPDRALLWTNLANAESKLGQTEAAESDYRKAIALQPDEADALNNLAWLLLSRGGKLDEAESLARQAVTHGGDDAAYYRDTLGRILVGRNDCAAAMAVFQEALVSPPQAARASLYEGLGTSQLLCGLPAQARTSFESAAKSSPDSDIKAALVRDLAQLQ